MIKGEKSKISSLIHDLFLSIETHRNENTLLNTNVQRLTKGNVYIFKEYHNIIQGGGGGEGVNTLVLINVYTKFQQYTVVSDIGGGGGSYMYDML